MAPTRSGLSIRKACAFHPGPIIIKGVWSKNDVAIQTVSAIGPSVLGDKDIILSDFRKKITCFPV